LATRSLLIRWYKILRLRSGWQHFICFSLRARRLCERN